MKNGKKDINNINLSKDIDLPFNKNILKTNTFRNTENNLVSLRNTNFVSNIEMVNINDNDSDLIMTYKTNKYKNII